MTATFPLAPLDARVELDLSSAGWTDVTSFALQREGVSPPITIERGRPDETSQVSPSSSSFQLNNSDGRFTIRNPNGAYYTQLNKNTPVRHSVPGTGVALRMEDDSVSAAAAPVTSPPSSAVDVRIDVNLSDWSPCCLASVWESAGSRSWALLLHGDGTLTFAWSDGTATHTLSSDSSVPVGAPLTVRVTFVASTGVAMFFTGASGNAASNTGWTQLGDAQAFGSTALSAPTSAYIVGFTDQVAADFGVNGMHGLVADFVVQSSVAGTVVVHAAFSSKPAGTTSWTDAQGNAWSLSGSATLDSRSYRYHGEMSSLPVTWDPSGRDVWCPVTAGGVLRRLRQGSAPLPSTLRRYITQLAGAGLRAYWPCEDGPGTTQFTSGMQGGNAMLIDGNVKLAADSSFVSSAALPQIEQSVWTGRIAPWPDNGSMSWRFAANLTGSTATEVQGGTVAMLSTSGTAAYLSLNWSLNDAPASGILALNLNDSSGVPLHPESPELLIQPGQYLISVEVVNVSGTVTATLRAMSVKGVITSASASYTGTCGHATLLQTNRTDYDGNTGVGLDTADGLNVISAGHFWIQSQIQPLSGNVLGPWTAWVGEAAANRIPRLLAENGVQSRIIGYPDESVPMGVQSAGTLIDLLQECETADMGMLFEPRQSLAIGYVCRAALYNQVPLVIDYSASEFGQQGQPGELEPVDDDQYTANDILVQRGSLSGASGSTYRAVLDDGSPMSISAPTDDPPGVGDYQSQKTVNVRADAQLPDVGTWRVNLGTVDEQRVPSIPLNLARGELASLMTAILNTEIGDAVQLANLPSWMPPDDLTELVAGVTEQLAGYWYLISWNGIPGSPYSVMVAGDTVLGRGDTDGSQVTNSIGANATSFKVSVTGPSGNLWTYNSVLFTASGTFVPPGAVRSVLAQAWGGGGGGGGSNTTTTRGGGGGGGEFAAESALAMTPGSSYAVTVGAAGASSGTGSGGAGGTTTIVGNSVTVTAHGGAGGGSGGGSGAGGTGSANSAHFSGGGGGTSGAAGDGGGGGGGSGGTGSAGSAGGNSTTATGGAGAAAVTGGGPGGTGGNHSLPGSAPAAGPGGGGGGAGGNTGGNSGAGAAGQALISWTSADYPFDIDVGGERMTVTAIQGQSSPQTFTVTRGVNGIQKAHSAGTPVSLFQTPIVAL